MRSAHLGERDLRAALGIGVSWALAWVAFWAVLMVWMGSRAPWSPVKLLIGCALLGLLMGVPFGLGLTRGGRRTRRRELTPVRSFLWAAGACALVYGVYLGLFLRFVLDVETGLKVLVGMCVFSQFATVLWLLAIHGGAQVLGFVRRRTSI